MSDAAQKVLIIEPTQGRRDELCELFKQGARKFSYELDLVDDFETARRRLVTSAGAYSAVLMSWPVESTGISDDVQLLLTESPHNELLCMVVSEQAQAGARVWVGQRPNTVYALYEDGAELLRSLELGLAELEDQSQNGQLREKQLRVLLVDDSAASRVFFRRLLANRGYEVDTAASATEARSKIKGRRYDFAIIDYYLPEATGEELIRELRRDPATAELVCAIVTGAYSDQLIRRCLDSGAVECLFKHEATELLVSQIDAIARSVRDRSKLYEKEQLLDGILGSVGEGVYGVDDDNRISFVNDAAVRMLGYDSDTELLGQNADVLCAPDLRDASATERSQDAQEATVAWMQLAYASRAFLKPLSRSMKRRDGRVFDTTCTVWPLRVRDVKQGTVVAFREVSPSRSLEQQAWWHAVHDAETGLLNARYFDVQIESVLQQLKRSEDVHGLMVVGVYDREALKALDGRQIRPLPVSEQALACVKSLSRRLLDRARSTDLVAYRGQGRFSILLRDADAAFAPQIVNDYRILLEQEIGDAVSIGAGIAVLDSSIQSLNEIVALASLAHQVAVRRQAGKVELEFATRAEKPVATPA